jgi:hypothetical protein
MSTITKEESIVTQVAAKIASEIAIATSTDLMATLANFSIAFDAVKEVLFDAHGTGFATVEGHLQAAFPGTTVETVPAASVQYQAPAAPSGNLQIAGKQHGPLPAWLATAAANAGVGKVWDNRDTAEGTKRPHFKQADQANGAEPVAFWPPKGR